MRKSVMIIIATLLLFGISVQHLNPSSEQGESLRALSAERNVRSPKWHVDAVSREFVTAGLNGIYEAEFAGASKPEPELESKTELESESESNTELEAELELESEPEVESEPEAKPEPGIESELESKPEPGIESEPESKPEPEIESEPESVPGQEQESVPKYKQEKASAGVTLAEAEAKGPSSGEEGGPKEPEEPEVELVVLSPHEAVVKTYEELKSALTNDNGITTVYFGDNITLQAGIKISPKKSDIVIVGINPLEDGGKRQYTLTDIDSVSFYDTIYVDEAGTRTIHIRDLTIIGKNFYGPFSIYESVLINGVVVTYERVSYDGPQLCHNRRGTVRVIDSSARIHGGNGTKSQHQEFSEAKHLIFEGANAIESTSSTHSIFWHPAGGSFKLADDSSLAVKSPNTSAAYGVFYADGAAYKLDITIGSRSALDMTISGVAAPEANVTISGFTIHEGGAFRLNATGVSALATTAILKIGGELLVDRDAAFIIHGAGGPLRPLLRQQGGDISVRKDAVFRLIGESRYSELLNFTDSVFICDDASSVLLYNAGRSIASPISAGRMYASAQQINYWDKTVQSGFDFPPLYGWRKADESNFVIDGTLAIGASANFSKLSSNYDTGDPPGLPPDTKTFDMTKSRVLAFGRLDLIAAEPAASSGGIEGVTAAGASIRASFTQRGIDYTPPDVTADSNGWFHIQPGVALEEGTVIKLESNWQYLTAKAEITVGKKGSLGLFAPDVLEFYTSSLSPFKKTVKRLNPDWKIVVADERGTGGKWNVYARLDQEMFAESPGIPSLKGALIFIDDSGKASVLNTDTDILILEHTPPAEEDVLPITWDDDRGILLDVWPGTTFADTLYTATICWTIVDGV